MKARPINNRKMYAYFSPDGYIQVRSMADTKKLSRVFISKGESFSWKDYENRGYFIMKIIVDIAV